MSSNPKDDSAPPDDPKRAALARSATLHAHPERVQDELFAKDAFFDPRDGVQVKYEMLRRASVDGRSVSSAAATFGLSRPTFYQARDAFEREGLAGLLPAKKGPKRAHKLSEDVLVFVLAELEVDPGLKPARLAELIWEKCKVEVHPKSIGRALARREKKTP